VKLTDETYRFWEKVRFIGAAPGECWEWTAAKDDDGYGVSAFTVDGKKLSKAHRISWAIENGKRPDGLCICHSCDNPSCVNPSHLFPGTVRDNNNDKIAKGRHRGWRSPLRGRTNPHTAGERNANAKLTIAMVDEIRASSEKQHVIASRLGVSRPLISMVRNRRGWGHI